MKTSERVQRLLDAHKYDEAIQILVQIDNPKTTDWIRRIEAQRAATVRQNTQRNAMIILALCALCACGCPLYFWFVS